MQVFSVGKKYFDEFSNKLMLEKLVKRTTSLFELSSELGVSHQVIREELKKGLGELDYYTKKYDQYSAKKSRECDISKLTEIAAQFKKELVEYDGK